MRIGGKKLRKCKGKYMEYDKDKRMFVEREFAVGLFHQWGNDYEEFESGPGNFTVAIVELPDGKIVTPVAREVHFLDTEVYENE